MREADTKQTTRDTGTGCVRTEIGPDRTNSQMPGRIRPNEVTPAQPASGSRDCARRGRRRLHPGGNAAPSAA
eukprot:7316300-Lingulodinium_polyedra.AAC.1